MKLRTLDWLACPVCGEEFSLQDAVTCEPRRGPETAPESTCTTCHSLDDGERHNRPDGHACRSCYGTEVLSGSLKCRQGHVFRIRRGVPQLRIDQKLDRASVAIPGDTISVGASFGAEWSHFDYQQDRTWQWSVDERCELFLRELAMTPEDLRGKLVLDAGCGNGALSRGINRFGCEVIAVDASSSVETAFQHFAKDGNDRTHFLQGDLINLPLKRETVDVVYSSGVLHHNPDTLEALKAVIGHLAPGGRIYIWLYGPIPGLPHRLRETLRRTISPMPSPVKHAIVGALLPQAMFRQYLRTWRRKNDESDRLRWSERFINQLDHYTPRYRWEHTPDEVIDWFRELGFEKIEQTELQREERRWGFGITATKPDR